MKGVKENSKVYRGSQCRDMWVGREPRNRDRALQGWAADFWGDVVAATAVCCTSVIMKKLGCWGMCWRTVSTAATPVTKKTRQRLYLTSPALAGGFFTTSATWESLLSLLSVPSIHEDLKGKTPLEISQQIWTCYWLECKIFINLEDSIWDLKAIHWTLLSVGELAWESWRALCAALLPLISSGH